SSTHTAHPEFDTLSLHDALPIFQEAHAVRLHGDEQIARFLIKGAIKAPEQRFQWSEEQCQRSAQLVADVGEEASLDLIQFDQLLDRKSTRLNSSHSQISYAVFCL